MNIATLSAQIIQYRKIYAMVCLTLVIIITAGAARIGFDNHFSIFFDEGAEELVAYDYVQNKYTHTDNIYIALNPAGGDVFNKEFLAELQKFTESAWKLPFVKRVDSITNFQHATVVGSDLSVESIFSLDQQQWDIPFAKKILLAEPELLGLIINAKGTSTGVNILLNLPKDALAPSKIVNATRELAKNTFGSDTDVHIHGIAALNNAFMEATESDSATLMPIMFTLIFVMLAFMLRSVYQTFAVLAIVQLGSLCVIGVLGWLSLNINMVNIVAITIIMTLAVADCVHILIGYKLGLSQNKNKLTALEHSVASNLVPLFITSATTAIGFLALLFSDAPPIRELGVITAISVMLVFFMSITIFVWIVAKLPEPAVPINSESDTRFITFANFVIAKRIPILVIFAISAPIFLWGIGKNELNDHASQYFSESSSFAKSTQYITSNLTGMDSLAFSLNTKKPRGINDVTYLKTVEEFGYWLSSQPEVVHVKSYTDILKRMNRNTHNGETEFYTLPTTNAMAAQFLLLYSMSTSYGLGVEDRVTFDRSASQIVATLNINNPKQLIDLDNKAYQWLVDHSPDLATHGVSVPKLFANIGINNIKSMFQGNLSAIVIIALLLIAALRSVKFGILSLLPNLLPALLAIGFWGMVSSHINLAVAIVFSITLGIIVDDTVHFIHKYLSAIRKGRNPEDAIRYAFSTVGRAMLITTISLASGFIVLSASEFAVNSVMGILVCYTLIIALVIDLIVLPAFILVISGRQQTLSESTEKPTIKIGQA